MAILGQVHFTAATLLAIVQAAIGLAVAFGAGLTHEQTSAIIDVVTALAAALPLGGAIIGHAQLSATGATSS